MKLIRAFIAWYKKETEWFENLPPEIQAEILNINKRHL